MDFYRKIMMKQEEKQHICLTIRNGLVIFPQGIAFGYLFYWVVLIKFVNGILSGQVFQIVSVLVFGFGWLISVNARCTSCLLIPALFTKKGRFFVVILGYSLVLRGPINSINANSQKLFTSTLCNWGQETAFNIRELVERVASSPALSIITNSLNIQTYDQQISNGTDQVWLEADNIEIEGLENVDYEELGKEPSEAGEESKDALDPNERFRSIAACKDYFIEQETLCKNQANKAEGQIGDWCSFGIARARNCPGVSSFVNCPTYTEGDLNKYCRSPDERGSAESDNDENAVQAPDLGENPFAGRVDVNLDQKLYPRDPEQQSAEELGKDTAYEFEKRTAFVNFILNILRRLTDFIFLLMIYSAYLYNKAFQTNLKFDNVYITSYFERIDEKREDRGLMTLLPMRGLEAKLIIPLFSFKLTKNEKKKLVAGIILWIQKLIVIIIIIFVDRTIHDALITVSQLTKVTRHTSGYRFRNTTVTGDGPTADLVRGFLNTFDTSNEQQIDITIESTDCFSDPTKTENFTQLFGMLILELFLISTTAYGLRVRAIIGGFYYRKVQKKRIIWLYNDSLKRRLQWLRIERHQLRRRAKNGTLALLMKLTDRKKKLPKKIKCKVCGIKEARENIYICRKKACRFEYCHTCWSTIKGMCIACTDPDQLGKELSEVSFKSLN